MQFAELNPKMMKIQEIDVTNLPKLLEMKNSLDLFKKLGNGIAQSVAESIEDDFKNLLDISNKSL